MQINNNYNNPYSSTFSNTENIEKNETSTYEELFKNNLDTFKSAIEKTLEDMDNTSSLLQNLQEAFANFARQISESIKSDEPPQLEMDTDFMEMSLVGYIQKKMEELKEMAKDGKVVDEQKILEELARFFGEVNVEALEEGSSKVNILA